MNFTLFSDFILDLFRQVQSTVVEPFSRFGVADAFDILFLAAAFFGIYRFIRYRRAFKLLLGVIALFLLDLLSAACGFTALHEIFRWLNVGGAAVFAVAFLYECRDLLETVGTVFFRLRNLNFRSADGDNAETMLSVVSDAAMALSKEKTGALIVLERTTKLGDYAKTGTEIDAAPSVKLFRNLFFNKSPLHDGAVIVSHGRIAAAGCILPTTKNDTVCANVGTRHRAGIGISEVSDAVVVIVSEENGVISIAIDGDLKRGYNAASLREALLPLMLGKERDRRVPDGEN